MTRFRLGKGLTVRVFGFLLLCLLAPLAAAASNSAASTPAVSNLDLAGSCAICHADITSRRSAKADLHAGFGCDTCHLGRTFNPHVPPTLDKRTQEDAGKFRDVAKQSAPAYTQCANCHADAVAAWQASVHGPRPDDKSGLRTPNCTDCHGSIHTVSKESQSKLNIATNCIACHTFSDAKTAPKTPFVVDTYRDTIHGKMVVLGSPKAAGCADCHTGHNVFPPSDPRSSVNTANRLQTCGKCHNAPTRSFVEAISHTPHTVSQSFWAGLTVIGFSVLTLGVIAALFLHVLLDFLRIGHRAWVRPEPAEHAADGPIAADAEVERFDIHMRLQHWGMMASFIVLVVTGWPLKAARIGASMQLAGFLGGQHVLALIHRVAGAVLIAVAVYHLIYLVALFRRGRLSFSMMPFLNDITDAIGNVLYFLGAKEERPRFERWTYYEKFDYWAVFWGMLIMGGSGLILWFPVLSSNLLPGELISLSYIAHSDEALLALLAIFLWHFYNTHLRPTIFPMSWVWLTGRISVEALYEEHRGEYERLFGEKPPAAPARAPGWHARPVWSYLAVALLLFAGVAVVAGNISSVREQIGTLTGEQTAKPASTSADAAPGAAGSAVSVYDARFDAFSKCFACHNRERFERGGAGFPHRRHLEEIKIGAQCKDCHAGTWHKKMEAKTELCVGCHKPEDVGLSKSGK
jgi:cytochrome b subunit of formate dehydrogenase